MYLVCAIDADTMAGRQETIEQFLARGGKIKIIPSCGKFRSHTSRWHYPKTDNRPIFQKLKSKQAKNNASLSKKSFSPG